MSTFSTNSVVPAGCTAPGNRPGFPPAAGEAAPGSEAHCMLRANRGPGRRAKSRATALAPLARHPASTPPAVGACEAYRVHSRSCGEVASLCEHIGFWAPELQRKRGGRHLGLRRADFVASLPSPPTNSLLRFFFSSSRRPATVWEPSSGTAQCRGLTWNRCRSPQNGIAEPCTCEIVYVSNFWKQHEGMTHPSHRGKSRLFPVHFGSLIDSDRRCLPQERAPAARRQRTFESPCLQQAFCGQPRLILSTPSQCHPCSSSARWQAPRPRPRRWHEWRRLRL